MEISKTDLYLSLGSNIGDRLGYLREAIVRINMEIGTIKSISPVYETPPWGFDAATPFLNLCVLVPTKLSAKSVMEEIKQIEKVLGREKSQVKGYSSRKIDIDIILYGHLCIDLENLHIPHPRFRSRKFVLQPLKDIAKDVTDPFTNLTIAQLFGNCQDISLITCYSKELQSNS